MVLYTIMICNITTSKKGMGLSLNPILRLLLQQPTGAEYGRDVQLMQVDLESPSGIVENPEVRAGQKDPEITFPVGRKTKLLTWFATKHGPTKIPASTKRPTKIPGKGSNSKDPVDSNRPSVGVELLV